MKKHLLAALLAFGFAGSFAQTSYTYTGKPTFQILAVRAGTTIGTINLELFPTIAPLHTRNFDSLTSFHFYDTTAFHRVIPGFMIQGGDPNSRHGPTSTWGFGQAGQPTVDAEFSALKHKRGIVSMARVGGQPNSATSQFFICVATASQLDGQYSIFGRVTAGMSVVDNIVNSPRNTSNDMPLQKIEMFVTRIGSNDTIPNVPVLTLPADSAVAIDTTFVQLKWNTVPGAYLYDVEISRDPIFLDTLKTLTTANTIITLNSSDQLTGNTDYFWHVRSNNGGNRSAWSETFMFHTKGETTGVASYSQRKNPVLVFPNPGNGKFTFAQLEAESEIEITDLSGRTIYKTTAKDPTLGVNLETKDKGIYFYKVSHETKGFWQGKLVLR